MCSEIEDVEALKKRAYDVIQQLRSLVVEDISWQSKPLAVSIKLRQ